MAKSNEAVAWSLFSAGGVVAALLLPITIVLIGLAVPAGLLTEQRLSDLIHHPLTRLYLFVVISLSLFHGMHRFRFVLADLGLKPMSGLLAFVCYGVAILGTVLAVVLLAQL